MTVKAIRTRRVRVEQDSFSSWLEARDTNEPYLGPLADRYPSVGSQIDLSWQMHLYDFDPDDPYGSRLLAYSLQDRAIDERWLDEVEAWNQHDFPEDADFHRGCAGYTFEEDYERELDDFLEETTSALATSSLDDRLLDTFPDDFWKTPSKKHREGDRTARNERRDGSPRDKVKRSVDKAYNESLRREERRESRHALVFIAYGILDADDVPSPLRGTLPYWDKGTPPESKQA